jgi:hypothetical protein
MRPMSYCPKCDEMYPLGFFARKGVRYTHRTTGRRAICKGCEQTARDKEKAEDAWRVKAGSTRRHHARRLKVSIPILEQQYGWELAQMAHEAGHAYENNCPGCRKSFKGMRHGLGDITLDIIDRAKDPFYVTNTRWICMTCNREKARTPPEEWAETLIGWRIFERRQKVGPAQRRLLFEPR